METVTKTLDIKYPDGSPAEGVYYLRAIAVKPEFLSVTHTCTNSYQIITATLNVKAA